MTDLSRIQDIRSRKLDKQRRTEREVAMICNDRRLKMQEAYQAVENYMEEIKTLEIDLLNELVQTELDVSDLKEFQSKLKDAENKAQHLSKNHADATAQLAHAEQIMEQERQKSRRIQSKLKKITELNRLNNKEAAREAIAHEDATMDEIAELMFAQRQKF